jgi:uncharacterized protein YgbK (DUF1537 family)
VRLIFADDLTGACDVAAAVGSPAWVPLGSGVFHHPAGVLVRSTESRDLSPEEARAMVARALKEFPGPVSYWKVDSLLRGNWAHELAEALAQRRVEHLLVAPAFPEQSRTTRAGVQYAHDVPVSEYGGAGEASIEAQLRGAGVPADRFRIADAATTPDLERAAAGLLPGETPVGSAGLARALYRPLAAQPRRVSGAVLVIVGTASVRGREQMGPLRGLRGVVLVEPEAPARLMRAIEKALRQTTPEAFVVVGGDTLARTAQLIGAQGLLVLGETAPGMAAARIAGGRFDSCQLITKAGDFGDRDSLLHAASRLLDG